MSSVLKEIARISAILYLGQLVMQSASSLFGSFKNISQNALATTQKVKMIVPNAILRSRNRPTRRLFTERGGLSIISSSAGSTARTIPL